MRTPNLQIDGWCLEDGEQLNLAYPATFLIPDHAVRDFLQPGDFAKLVFRIATEEDGSTDPVERVERMWVIVRERTESGYLGTLDNEPGISENNEFWLGTELPFQARHIIAVEHANEASLASAQQPAHIPWQ